MSQKREPSADMVKLANGLREWFEALLRAGFTEAQAIGIIGTALGQAIRPASES